MLKVIVGYPFFKIAWWK